MVSCPEPIQQLQAGWWPSGVPFAPNPTPSAFATVTLAYCESYHAAPGGYLVTAFEINSGGIDWDARSALLGSYTYPNDTWKLHPEDLMVTSPGLTHVNPWAVQAILRSTDSPNSTMYTLIGLLDIPGGTNTMETPPGTWGPYSRFTFGDASESIPPVVPTEYERNFSAPFSDGYYNDTALGHLMGIPGGTAVTVRTYVGTLGDEDPEPDVAWTLYRAYILPPFGPPPSPLCAPDAPGWISPPESAPWYTGGPANFVHAWRGGDTDTIHAFMTGTVPPSEGPFHLYATAFRDPMGLVYARRNGGAWVPATVPADQPPYKWDWMHWPDLDWEEGDTSEIGAANASSGAWSSLDYSDPRMGRMTVAPFWLRCEEVALDDLAWVSAQIG